MNSLWTTLRTILVWVFAAFGAGVLAWHLWVDHASLHQLIGGMNSLASRHPELFK